MSKVYGFDIRICANCQYWRRSDYFSIPTGKCKLNPFEEAKRMDDWCGQFNMNIIDQLVVTDKHESKSIVIEEDKKND